MIRSVVRVYGWTPKDFESLYLDDADFFGLEYWYNDAIEFDKSQQGGGGVAQIKDIYNG